LLPPRRLHSTGIGIVSTVTYPGIVLRVAEMAPSQSHPFASRTVVSRPPPPYPSNAGQGERGIILFNSSLLRWRHSQLKFRIIALDDCRKSYIPIPMGCG